MSQLKLSGDASGTGIVTVAAPNTNSTYTVTLPAAAGTLARTDAAQTFTGTQTFSSDASVNGLTVGRGAGAVSTNTAVGALSIGASSGGVTGTNNTALGYATLSSTTSGSYNTGSGWAALNAITNGSYNTANGAGALQNNTASNNTAVGYQAGYSNTTGTRNLFQGYQAAYYNTTGNDNTALGYGAYGWNTGAVNATGSSNTAVGSQALAANTTASNNTAVGYQAGYSNTTGAFNTVVGYQAGNGITLGQRNCAFGDRVLKDCTSGSNNIGFGFTNSTNGYDPVFNPTTESDRLVAGHTTITNAYVKVAWTVTSDARDKTNIEPVPHGLDFVQQLNPVSYRWKTNRENDTPVGTRRYGFLAQEILALEGQSPVIIDNEKPEHLKYQGESLVPVLVKAIQELKSELDTVKAELAALKA